LKVKDILTDLDLGSSVAEHDAELERYFVETETFRALIGGRVDVIAGDKGTGKSALYRILSQRRNSLTELADIEVVSAFNPTGTPVFQRLAEGDVLSEAQYIKIWKAYFLALAGNWILEIADGDHTPDMARLHEVLTEADLRTSDDTPGGVFSKIMAGIRRALGVKSAEGSAKLWGAELSGKLEFAVDTVTSGQSQLDHDESLRILERVLGEMDTKIWLTLDRLDEAFQGRPALEYSALRALFRAYLDLQEFDRLKLKLFVRKDLFGRIISGGFVNLTHVNARKIEIVWDAADLRSLLFKRVMENAKFVKHLQLSENQEEEEVFSALFPEKVEPGSKRPVTWKWILSRIEDGNQIRPPRNLVDLVLKSREAQLRREDRAPREYVIGTPVITGEAIKAGHEALSSERVEDTLLAESGEYAAIIERFRNGKAEHNSETLQAIIGDDYENKVDYLRSIGFLGDPSLNFKIPMLYRRGLGITQGKAFAPEMDSIDEEEE
jgi:hypothetical protein